MIESGPIFSDSILQDSMVSLETMQLLYHHGREAAERNDGIIVEIGAYRGASTIALAMAVRDAGKGHVYSIDPHLPRTGILGGTFSPDDHTAFNRNLDSHGLGEFVTHLCTDSASAAMRWTRKIDLLWIDGDHSYQGVSSDLQAWLGLLWPHGIAILDDFRPDSEVASAARDNLPYSRFQTIEHCDGVLILRRLKSARTMYLCGGMQSSGSTLISKCFLQHPDLDGVYDMDNPFIQHDFANVFTNSTWVKMTIGSFRLKELVDLYSAQGWNVRPLLVCRAPQDMLDSLVGKPYGNNGCTGDDPPLLVRLERYLADLEHAKINGWPIIDYSDFVADPEAELRRACDLLGLDWSDALSTWPKAEGQIAYPSLGSPSLRNSLQGPSGLAATIARYSVTKRERACGDLSRLIIAAVGSDPKQSAVALLPPSQYQGTRRQIAEGTILALREELTTLRQECFRVSHHFFFGRLLRAWRRIVNHSFPTLR